ncbi:MAG TPA: GNAT family N-acetyltransferase [Nocardioides sp.]|nr:GNAT family N-acetyltransferase [Nocardioides sp.]
MNASRPPGVTIRRAVPDDAEALTHLHLDCWDDAYTGLVPQPLLDARRADVPSRVDFWRGALEQGAVVWLAEHDGGLVGFSGAGDGREPVAEVTTELRVLYVRAAWWGAGVGHDLLEAALGDRAAYLCVLEGNDRAIGFYERHGFARDGHVERAPEGPHVRMVRRSLRP